MQAEIEEIAAGEGGRGKKPANSSPRAEELSSFIDRHKSHIVRLEQVRRNSPEQLSPCFMPNATNAGVAIVCALPI